MKGLGNKLRETYIGKHRRNKFMDLKKLKCGDKLSGKVTVGIITKFNFIKIIN